MKPIIIGIGVVILAVFLVVPGTFTSLLASLGGTAVSCSEAPFASGCTCDDGERKWQQPAYGILTQYTCQVIEEPDMDEISFVFAKDVLTGLYPSCDTITCENDMIVGKTTIPTYSYGLNPETGNEYALVECRSFDPSNTQSDLWWTITVNLNDGSLMTGMYGVYPICVSTDGTVHN